jgi:4-hydroxybenzoate 3-monooxygenase
MLSHLLAREGIDSVVVDNRTYADIEQTVRAGILEHDSVRMLVDTGVSDRVLREGDRHEGIEIGVGGGRARIDFQDLVGTSVWLYPQTDVFIDVAAARARDGGDVRFGISNTSITGVTGDEPMLAFTDAEGIDRKVRCQYIVGADGSRSYCRQLIPSSQKQQYVREYPFAWFGILCEAPKSAPELIYNHSDLGFALISQRTEDMQRMYFQCDPDTDVNGWSDDRIWDQLQSRVGANGITLQEGPITSRAVLRFRSFVCEPMRHGRLLLAGDAAHTVPPTGAKGLNLALADVQVLAEILSEAVTKRRDEPLAAYTERALARVWKAQHFSYWMTSMLHRPSDGSPFDLARQRAEIGSVLDSVAASTYLAEGYTGWPSKEPDRERPG